ncbi:unnamed protein product [Rotaria sp. Silwood2]|nr:unnamed protein product [Rotaria sp. Silwood2]CAF4632013.1 unnamed protein product [Rotaria sp. Silwood2]
MSASSSSNACTKCSHIFRSGERKLLLQNSTKLCRFVFSSGAIDLTKLIDVTQVHIPLCNRCYQVFNHLYETSMNTNANLSMEITETGAEKFASSQTQTDDSYFTQLARSESFNMIVDQPTTAMTIVTSSSNQLPTQFLGSTTRSILLPFYRLTKSNNRCTICGDYFANSEYSSLQIESYIRIRALIEHSILVMTPARCCTKHISNGYFTAAALQIIQKQEKTCEASSEELIDIFNVMKSELLPKLSIIEGNHDVPPLNFEDTTHLTSDNYYVLTGLNRKDFDNLCSCIPPASLRNTQNRTARVAVACLLMKLRLGISHQVLAALFSFPDKVTVSRVIHSARKALVAHFVPRFLGFQHISRREVIDWHTRPLAMELLSDQPDRAILILDGTYIYCQKSANNVLQRRTYSMHKGRPLLKPMLVVTTTGYIVSCLGPYFADYKNNDAAITKHIIYNNKENITQWLHKGDILVIDRGFRDALDYLHKHNYQTFMPAFLDKNSKQFSTRTGNETRFVTKIRWIIESANGRIKQWRIFDKVLPNSLLKTVGDLVGIVCALQNAYGAPFIKSALNDKKLAEKMLRLRDKTNELGDFVARLKEKSEKSIKWADFDAADTVSDFPKLTFEELNELTLG